MILDCFIGNPRTSPKNRSRHEKRAVRIDKSTIQERRSRKGGDGDRNGEIGVARALQRRTFDGLGGRSAGGAQPGAGRDPGGDGPEAEGVAPAVAPVAEEQLLAAVPRAAHVAENAVEDGAGNGGRRVDGQRAAHDVGDGAEAPRGRGGGGRSGRALAPEPRRARRRWRGAAHGGGGGAGRVGGGGEERGRLRGEASGAVSSRGTVSPVGHSPARLLTVATNSHRQNTPRFFPPPSSCF
jgi:hypothetical protein